MEATPPKSAGFIGALQTLGEGLFTGLQQRVELFSVELQEEKFRVIRIFIWISAAVFTGMMTVAFASLTLVYIFWDSARLWVLGGLTGFYAIALVGIIIAFRRHLAGQPPPFAATIDELAEDRACIRNES